MLHVKASLHSLVDQQVMLHVVQLQQVHVLQLVLDGPHAMQHVKVFALDYLDLLLQYAMQVHKVFVHQHFLPLLLSSH